MRGPENRGRSRVREIRFTPLAGGRKLLQCMTDLRVLIDAMKDDRTLHAQGWQVRSLEDSLANIEKTLRNVRGT